MKHTLTILLLAVVALLTACNKPKEIPDKDLGAIFRDAMLVNAYLAINPGTNLDSLRVYEPIFARYGYTAEDVQYTVHNFSRRKSAHLSDVAEYMILLLDREANALNLQVAKLDTVERVARRRYTKVVRSDTAVNVRKEASFDHKYDIMPEDTSFVRLVIDMAHFNDSKQKTTTRMLVHDLKVTYTPPLEKCVEMLFNEQSNMRIFSDTLIRAIEEGARQ